MAWPIVLGAMPFAGSSGAGVPVEGGTLTLARWPAGPVDVGDIVTVAVQAVDAAGNPGPADLVLCSITFDGVASPLSVEGTADGLYTASFPTAAPGNVSVVFVGTGGVLGTGQVYADSVEVADTSGLFISVAQALAHLRAANVVTAHADREQLRWLCLVACRAVERDLGRVIARQVVIEEHEPTGSALILRQTPVLSVTSVSVDGTVQDASGYRLGLAGILRSRTGWPTGGWSTVTVEYVAGMELVPVVLQKVALNAVQRMWQTSQNSPHPAFDDGGGGGGGDFAATAILGQMGRLTPVEYGAYRSYQSTGIA